MTRVRSTMIPFLLSVDHREVGDYTSLLSPYYEYYSPLRVPRTTTPEDILTEREVWHKGLRRERARPVRSRFSQANGVKARRIRRLI